MRLSWPGRGRKIYTNPQTDTIIVLDWNRINDASIYTIRSLKLNEEKMLISFRVVDQAWLDSPASLYHEIQG